MRKFLPRVLLVSTVTPVAVLIKIPPLKFVNRGALLNVGAPVRAPGKLFPRRFRSTGDLVSALTAMTALAK